MGCSREGSLPFNANPPECREKKLLAFLAKSPFVAGDSFTLADICFMPCLQYCISLLHAMADAVARVQPGSVVSGRNR